MTSKLQDNPLWVIYGLRLVDDPEYRYVGYTTIGTDRRLEKHKKDTVNRDFYVHRWMRSCGLENIDIDILEECSIGDMASLGEAEEFWITQIRSFGHRLTNLNSGGKGGNSGWKHSEDSKAKISKSLLALGMKGERHPNWGRTLSESHRRNLSMAGTGRVQTEETKARMRYSWDKVDKSIRSAKAVYANHKRWHLDRNIIKEGCIHCIE